VKLKEEEKENDDFNLEKKKSDEVEKEKDFWSIDPDLEAKFERGKTI
jgi:hypothetical protein